MATIQQTIERKKKLEQEILLLLLQFQNETGVVPERVALRHIDHAMLTEKKPIKVISHVDVTCEI